MKNELIFQLKSRFDILIQKVPESDVEFWFARDIQEQLGYIQWRNFLEVIDKAKLSCTNAGAEVANHFADVGKMVKIGSGAERQIDDIMLTRYACYLEELPPEEDLKILERRIKSSESKMIKGTGLPKN